MALSADRSGYCVKVVHDQFKFGVAASTTIYLHALVSFNADGYLVPADDDEDQDSKKTYMAIEAADNSEGADGDVMVMCITHGTIIAPNDTVNAITQADVGLPAHAISDNVVSNTSTNNRGFGAIQGLNADGVVIEF